MGLYEFMAECQEEGLEEWEALQQWGRIEAESRQAFIDWYEDRPETWDGWHQQDMIDLRRREQ